MESYYKLPETDTEFIASCNGKVLENVFFKICLIRYTTSFSSLSLCKPLFPALLSPRKINERVKATKICFNKAISAFFHVLFLKCLNLHFNFLLQKGYCISKGLYVLFSFTVNVRRMNWDV